MSSNKQSGSNTPSTSKSNGNNSDNQEPQKPSTSKNQTNEQENDPNSNGKTVELEGTIFHETDSGMLVISVPFKGKTYVGTLLDSARFTWAPPRFGMENESGSETRMGKRKGKNIVVARRWPFGQNVSTARTTRRSQQAAITAPDPIPPKKTTKGKNSKGSKKTKSELKEEKAEKEKEKAEKAERAAIAAAEKESLNEKNMKEFSGSSDPDQPGPSTKPATKKQRMAGRSTPTKREQACKDLDEDYTPSSGSKKRYKTTSTTNNNKQEMDDDATPPKKRKNQKSEKNGQEKKKRVATAAAEASAATERSNQLPDMPNLTVYNGGGNKAPAASTSSTKPSTHSSKQTSRRGFSVPPVAETPMPTLYRAPIEDEDAMEIDESGDTKIPSPKKEEGPAAATSPVKRASPAFSDISEAENSNSPKNVEENAEQNPPKLAPRPKMPAPAAPVPVANKPKSPKSNQKENFKSPATNGSAVGVKSSPFKGNFVRPDDKHADPATKEKVHHLPQNRKPMQPNMPRVGHPNQISNKVLSQHPSSNSPATSTPSPQTSTFLTPQTPNLPAHHRAAMQNAASSRSNNNINHMNHQFMNHNSFNNKHTFSQVPQNHHQNHRMTNQSNFAAPAPPHVSHHSNVNNAATTKLIREMAMGNMLGSNSLR